MSRTHRKLDFNNWKCFGRDHEISLLKNACLKKAHDEYHNDHLEVNSSGIGGQLVLIKGESGLGKTYLVETALQRMKNKVLAGTGKHSFQEATPFAAIRDCLSSLTEQLEVDSLKTALGPSDSALLADTLLPHWKNEIMKKENQTGSQREKEDIPQDIQSGLGRLDYAVRALIRVICAESNSKTVVLFLDDLQWAGQESLNLLKVLLHDPKLKGNLVILAASRPDTTCSTSQLSSFLDQLGRERVSNTGILTIQLQELQHGCLQELLSHVLHRDMNDSNLTSLTRLIRRKTGGNPFFVLQFLYRLEQQELVYYDATSTFRWEWEEHKILEEMSVTDQVVDLIKDNIQTIPSKVKLVLQCAALLGMNQFDTETLFPTVQVLQEQIVSSSGKADLEPVKTLEEMCQLLHEASVEGLLEMIYTWKYKFVHDSILESAAELLPNCVSKLRRTVGSKFLELSHQVDLEDAASVEKRDKYLLLAVQQLQLAANEAGIRSMTEKQREGLARLHIRAAKVQIGQAAYFPALDHLESCISLLGDDNQTRWTHQYRIMLEACTIRARMYLACGYPDIQCRALVDDIIEHGASFDDTIAAYDCLVHLLTVQSNFEEALDVCLTVLDNLDIHLPRHYHTFHVLKGILALKSDLRKKTDEELISLPPMTDSNMIHALRFLSQVVEAAFFAVKPTYLALAVIKQLKISMKYGSCDQTAEAFSHGAMLFGPIGDYESAFRIGQLGYELAKKEKTHHDGLAIFVTFYFINHWQRPYIESLNPMMHAHQVMIDCGGFHKAWYPLIAYALLYYCCGLALEPLARDLKKLSDTMIDCGQKMHIQHTLPLQQMILNFMGQCENPLVLTGEAMDQEQFLAETKDVPRAQNEYHRCRMILAYYFGDIKLAEQMSERMPSAAEEGSVAMLPLHNLYQGLIYLALAGTTQQRKYYRKAKAITTQVRTWVKKGNPNCHHMLLLLQAEMMSLKPSKKTTSRIKKEYDDSIASAARSGFLHHQALANERAANFFVRCNDGSWAALYFRNARDLYREYGALAKAKHVAELCAHHRLEVGTSLCSRSNAFFARERLPKQVTLLAKEKGKSYILETTEATHVTSSS